MLIHVVRVERYGLGLRRMEHLLSVSIGLIKSQAGHEAGEGVAYLKSVSVNFLASCRSRSRVPGVMVDRHVYDDRRGNM